MTVDPWLAGWTPPGPPRGRSAAFRRELGLPDARPIVMTGHQPTFWHAGILAKYIAAEAIARRTDAAAAWCVPDQDVVEPGVVRRPVRRERRGGADGPGRWFSERTSLLRWKSPVGGVPAGMAAPGSVVEPVPEVFRDLTNGLREGPDTGSAAAQVWRAHASVMRDRAGLPEAPTVYATGISRTRLFADLVEEMAAEPDRCVRAYNDAARSHPEAGVRTLERGELPLWHLEPGMGRRAVFAEEARDGGSLAPRGLLFTGMLRMAGCDLFLHGTGGGAYDRVTEAWLGEWVGVTLCPAGVVSATVLPDLGVPDATGAELQRARWRLHHAMHNPGLLGDRAAQEEKLRMVERIERAERSTEARGEVFRAVHELLERVRGERDGALAALRREVEEIEAALADRELALDRTWPWVLHGDERLAMLREEIERAVGVKAVAP